jgi:hypothetical protein
MADSRDWYSEEWASGQITRFDACSDCQKSMFCGGYRRARNAEGQLPALPAKCPSFEAGDLLREGMGA